MKKLGFGLMRMPTLDKTNQADVDIEQVKAMVDRFDVQRFCQRGRDEGGAGRPLSEGQLHPRHEAPRRILQLHGGTGEGLYRTVGKNRRGIF